ncbi:uncharacterized protein LOC111885768 [Lactuca sativa]|uniref:Late embryogenesis abundant protein LEA-2 subgroup domain-containing protein n=1 Tax=Lactuca sativa TaxID=4236 RepID=A0A9R1WYQ5_LACSA|nr:uncharacterized protein LOC111885768 [Lactuca sativa]KAJ0192576.1 hypothetical protein LSAT_V11C800433820 [Lactuca sativa]
MDVEKKDEQPLTTIVADDKHRRKRKRRRCICLSVIAVIVLLALIILILALTVFKAKKPVTSVNSIAISDFDVSVNLLPPRVSLNISLDLDISIKNPNKVGVKYRNSSAILLYKDKDIGEVPIPAGEIGSDDTKRLNLTLTVFADRLLTNFDVYSDVISGSLPVSTYTKISGKARILNMFNIHISSVSSCDLNIDISNRRISNQTCHYKNRL